MNKRALKAIIKLHDNDSQFELKETLTFFAKPRKEKQIRNLNYIKLLAKRYCVYNEV